MRIQVRHIYTLAAIAALSGCAKTLSIEPLTLDYDPNGPVPAGVPYSLYFDQFKVEASYRIASCSPMKLEVTADVTEQVAQPDADQAYMIDPNSMAGLFRTSEFEISYNPDGSVSAINVKAEDRTAEALGSIAKGMAGIVKIAAAGAGLVDKTFNCSADALALFKAYEEEGKKLEAAKAALVRAQSNFDTWNSKVDGVSQVVPRNVQTGFDRSYMTLQGAFASLSAAKKRHDAAAGKVTVKSTFNWPESGGERSSSKPLPAPLMAKLKKWVVDDGTANFSPNAYQLNLALAPRPANPMSTSVGEDRLTKKELERGIPYRNTAPGTLSIEVVEAVSAQPESIFEKQYSVRQLGRVMQLPCTSKAFTKIGCSLAFTDKGMLSKAGTKNEKAPGESVATLFGTLVDAGGTATEALRARDERRRTAAKTAKQEELAMFELEAKLEVARKAALGPAPKTDLLIMQDQILRYDTELKLLEVERKLREERAKVSGA